MGLLDGISEWYSNLDDVDRQNLFIAIGFIIVIIFAIYAVGNAFSIVNEVFGEGVSEVDKSMSGLSNFTENLASRNNDTAISYY